MIAAKVQRLHQRCSAPQVTVTKLTLPKVWNPKSGFCNRFWAHTYRNANRVLNFRSQSESSITYQYFGSTINTMQDSPTLTILKIAFRKPESKSLRAHRRLFCRHTREDTNHGRPGFTNKKGIKGMAHQAGRDIEF